MSDNISSDFLSALRRIRSSNQAYRNTVSKNIVSKAGLEATHVVDGIHDTRDASFPTTVCGIPHNEPDAHRLSYVSSWLGLVNKSPSMLTFFADSKGPDSLYKLAMVGDVNKLRQALDEAGISQRVLMPTKDGFNCLIHDPDRQLRGNVAKLARKTKSIVQETKGEGVFIGGGDAASSRKAYRDIINKYETQASVTPPPQPQEQQQQSVAQ